MNEGVWKPGLRFTEPVYHINQLEQSRNCGGSSTAIRMYAVDPQAIPTLFTHIEHFIRNTKLMLMGSVSLCSQNSLHHVMDLKQYFDILLHVDKIALRNFYRFVLEWC